MRGSSKMALIDTIRTTRYPLILMLCCDVFMFLDYGVVSEEVFSWLSEKLENWEELGLRLGIKESLLTEFNYIDERKPEKIYRMLHYWLKKSGSDATYTNLRDALYHPSVNSPDLAEKLTGNISLILQFSNNTITYK